MTPAIIAAALGVWLGLALGLSVGFGRAARYGRKGTP